MPPKLFPRGDSHPILARLYREDKNREANTYLKFLLIDRYFPVPRPLEPGAGHDRRTVDAAELPLARRLQGRGPTAAQRQLPVEDAKLRRVSEAAPTSTSGKIKDVLANGKQLYQLANAIEAMLTDAADPKDPAKPDLRAFWQQPASAELLGEVPAADGDRCASATRCWSSQQVRQGPRRWPS